jgi:hypothetical protein
MRRILTAICIGVAITVVLWWVYIFLSPNWLWVSYDTLQVADGMVGTPSPEVAFNANYYQSILIEWDRTLWQRNSSGGWDDICYTTGRAARYPGGISAKTTVYGLFDERDCAKNLTAGEYYIEDNISWDNVIRRTVFVESDPFIIDPAPAPVVPPRSRVVVPAPTPPPVVVGPPPIRVRHTHQHAKTPFPFNLFFH